MPRTKKPTTSPDLLHPEEEARLYELAADIYRDLAMQAPLSAGSLAERLRTFAQYHFERGRADGIFTAQRQAQREQSEPWDFPSALLGIVEGRHACPSCDQMTGENIDTLKDGWFLYQCAECGASWQADGENTQPEGITHGTV